MRCFSAISFKWKYSVAAFVKACSQEGDTGSLSSIQPPRLGKASLTLCQKLVNVIPLLKMRVKHETNSSLLIKHC